MSNPDRKASPEDLAEFGDHALAGAPSIAALIGVLPEEQRETYRTERRAALRAMGFRGTWREYLVRSSIRSEFYRLVRDLQHFEGP